MKKKKISTTTIPQFASEDEERDFWATHSVLDFPERYRPVNLDLSRLKPTTTSVTIRMTRILLEDLKRLANRNDVPYQSLMKIYLAERVAKEFGKKIS